MHHVTAASILSIVLIAMANGCADQQEVEAGRHIKPELLGTWEKFQSTIQPLGSSRRIPLIGIEFLEDGTLKCYLLEGIMMVAVSRYRYEVVDDVIALAPEKAGHGEGPNLLEEEEGFYDKSPVRFSVSADELFLYTSRCKWWFRKKQGGIYIPPPGAADGEPPQQ